MVARVSRAKYGSIRQRDLEYLRAHGRSHAFGFANEIHHHTIPVRQLGMHLPFDQGESPADAPVSSRELGEVVQVIYLASRRDLLGTHATSTKARDPEMMPLAVVIQSAFSSCGRTVISSRPLANAHSR